MNQHAERFRTSPLLAAMTISLVATGCGTATDYPAAATETVSLATTSAPTRGSAPASTTPTTTTTTTASTSRSSSTAAPTAVAASPIQGPLIQKANIAYQGVFALPSGQSNPSYSQEDLGTSRFGYGASAMSTYRDPVTRKLTLFISGHAHHPGNVAQVEVPPTYHNAPTFQYGALPVAKLLHKFRDLTNGDLGSATSTLGSDPNGPSVRGLLPYNGRLLLSAVNWYAYNQKASHGAATLALTDGQVWSGFAAPSGAVTPIRAVAGAMAPVPTEWQAALGSKAFTGASAVAIISAATFGPALAGFDPDTVGSGGSFPAKTLLFYPQSAPVCGAPGCDNTDNPIYNWGSQVRGFAAVPKSDSVLFVGTHGIGGYWYGGMTGPNGMQELPGNQWQGPHSTAYEYRVWAYRASDLARVASGQLKPWAVKPYAIIPLKELTDADPSGRIAGSAFDPESGQLFVATGYGDMPRLHVYKITAN